jgi:hypothetical protein
MRKLLSTAAAAAALLVGASMPAQAYILVQLTDVTGATTLTCNTSLAFNAGNCGAGFNTAAGADSFAFTGNVGLFSIGTLFSNLNAVANVPGTATEATIDQSMTRLRNTTAAGRSFKVSVTAFGYTLPVSPFKTLFGSQGMSTSANAGSAIADFYADGTNMGLLSNLTACAVVIGTNASCAATPVNWLSGPMFSLTQVQEFTMLASQDVNATLNLTTRNTVPEPLTTSLVGAALLALALTSARRASKV